eukprot:scaffold139407_cov127-Phaeocystis_antarctica.AAC.1
MPIVVGGALTMESIACFVAGSQSLVSKSVRHVGALVHKRDGVMRSGFLGKVLAENRSNTLVEP